MLKEWVCVKYVKAFDILVYTMPPLFIVDKMYNVCMIT